MKTYKQREKYKSKSRKQRGGFRWSLFPTLSFTLDLPTDRSLTERHTLSLYEQTNTVNKKLCTLHYIPNYEGTRDAYLEQIDCFQKTSVFKPISFVIMYRFLEELEKRDIQFVFFSVAATGNSYYKLFDLYHKMGFVCKPSEYDISTNLNIRKANANRRYILNNQYFKDFFRIIQGKNATKYSMNMFMRCMEMFGHVSTVKAKIESVLMAKISTE